VKRVLEALGAATVVASVLPLLATTLWIFELFTHFRVQLVATLALLALVFALRRAWRWCAALAFGLAVNVAPLVPYLRPGTTPAAAATLNVLSVNVQADNDEYAGLVDGIAQTRPDVVLVVEFTERWSERLASLDTEYPHQFLLPKEDKFGIALFSRYPLEAAEELEVGPTSTIDARVATPRGTVRLIGVHLRPPISARRARERNAQLAALVPHVAAAPEPLIVLGDFNMSPYSPYFASWLEQTGLRDARLGSGPDFTWPTFFPPLGVPIDHCIVSQGLAVAEYRRLPAFGSDHYPVLVRLVQEQVK
jgi:endonuclease/exonuclease/phosphatase (EEP) superfamily protein YafD